MADIAIPRHAASPETVAQERADEGRWESEGGGAMKKITPEKSAEAPLSELAKGSTSSTTSSSSSSSDADTVVAHSGAAKTSEYDANTHPSMIEGKPGNVEDSKYGHSGESKGAEMVTETKPPTAPRKKSISEKLSETWHDIKAKAEHLVHRDRKNSKDSRDTKDTNKESKDVTSTSTKETTQE